MALHTVLNELPLREECLAALKRRQRGPWTFLLYFQDIGKYYRMATQKKTKTKQKNFPSSKSVSREIEEINFIFQNNLNVERTRKRGDSLPKPLFTPLWD